MKRFLFLLCVFPHLAFCAWGDLFQENGDPTINNHVNVISGRLQLAFVDHVIEGAIPLPIQRSYMSTTQNNNHYSKWQFIKGWNFYPHTRLYLRLQGSENYTAHIVETSGVLATYTVESRGIDKEEIRMKPFKRFQGNSEIMSARLNPDNNRIRFNRQDMSAVLYLCDGTRRIYKASARLLGRWDRILGRTQGLGSEYLLEKEISTSGHITRFQYSEGFNERDTTKFTIKQTNQRETKVYSEATFQQHRNHKVHVSTSDYKTIAFNGEQRNSGLYLCSVENSHKPRENITYSGTGRVESITLDNDDTLKVIYNTRAQVEEIHKNGIKVASYTYDDRFTEVRDCNDVLTRYTHEGGSLLRVERYDKENKLYTSHNYLWNNGNLMGKEFRDKNEQILHSKTFKYDAFKNVTQETIHGNSRKYESYSKWYKYDKYHYKIEEREENGLVTSYKYHPNTDLPSKITKSFEGELVLEERFFYDEDNLLIEKRSYDGYRETFEKYKRDTQTCMIVEKDNGLQKVFYEYNSENKLSREFTEFGSTSIEYDKKGHVTKKTYPLGGEDEYLYNKWGNPTHIKMKESPQKNILYDSKQRPVSSTVNGNQTLFGYDKKGQVLCAVNQRDETNKYVYDEFGRCLTKINAMGQTESFDYDCHGNIILQIAPDGTQTKTSYNIFKKPTQVIYPDGSKIHNLYNKNGMLQETIHQDRSKTTYQYDVLNRMISKKHGGLEEAWKYEGLLLKSHTNVAGLVITYDYDDFGRKIAEEFVGRRKEFLYDEMGFCCEIREGEFFTKQVHDVEGNIIETSENGFHKIRSEYDKEGRKTKVIKQTSQGEAVDQLFYDDEGRMIKHINPLGHESQVVYNDYCNTKTEIDALGNQSYESYDSLDQLIKKQNRSTDGEVLLSEKFFYDSSGNIIQRFTEDHDQQVEYTYDSMGRVIEELESGKKKTLFEYDIKGRLKSKVTPNGNSINYTYDDLDRMIVMATSDGSVNYEYIYSGLNLFEIKDHILGKSIKRSYTRLGQLESEIGLSGFKTSWFYDTFGRVEKMVLPDDSFITYSYKGSCMTSVARFNKKGDLQYKHKYTKFDENQHVEKEELAFKLGTMKSRRDILERPTNISSAYHSLALTFGPTNLVTQKESSLTGAKNYAYDAMSQLSKEGETTFRFDSLGNPTNYEINDLNQIVSTPTETMSYDANGNLTKRDGKTYSYDALNRLTQITYCNDRKVVFTYDPESRLVSKETFHKNKFHSKKLFLYDKDYEIGSINEKGGITELKVLGLGVKGDIGASIALELHGEVYIPLHDLQGNITAILNSTGSLIESYDYNAFGETPLTSYLNPWRFSSKRTIEDLTFFGRRFYDPSLKRWISPDPLGFIDSRNPYAYVLNSPLNSLDQFGLYAYQLHQTEHASTLGYVPSQDTLNYIVNRYQAPALGYKSPSLYTGTSAVDGYKTTATSICSRPNFSFNLSVQERAEGQFNLFDHLSEYLNKDSSQIQITTFQNGIGNNEAFFQSTMRCLGAALPQGTLLVGIHNETKGLKSDLGRANYLQKGGTMENSYQLYGLLIYILDLMDKYAPRGHCLHICHSEGAAVFNSAISLMSDTDKERMNERYFVLAHGPAQCVPNDHVINAVNIYSKMDGITGWFAEKQSARYNVKWVDCITPFSGRICGLFDHGLTQPTYWGALTGKIDEFQTKGVGFYVGHYR